MERMNQFNGGPLRALQTSSALETEKTWEPLV